MNSANLSYFYSENFMRYFCDRFGYKNAGYVISKPEYYFNAPILYKENRVESGLLSYLPLPYYSGAKGTKTFKSLMKDYLAKVEIFGAQRIALRQDPCVEYDDGIIKTILAAGFEPDIFYTTVVDLTIDEADLWHNLRKRYRSYINNLKNDSKKTLIKVDAQTCEKYFDDWAALYTDLLARGGKVLCADVFNGIKESVTEGTGFLYLLYEQEMLICGIHINAYTEFTYYSAGGIKPEYEQEESFMHYIMYSAILDLKKNGFKKLEIGPVFYDSVRNFYTHSEKEKGISHFKLGMGGILTPFVIFTKSCVVIFAAALLSSPLLSSCLLCALAFLYFAAGFRRINFVEARL